MTQWETTNRRAQDSTSQVGKAYSITLVGFPGDNTLWPLIKFFLQSYWLSTDLVSRESGTIIYMSLSFFFTGVWHIIGTEYIPTAIMRYVISQYMVILWFNLTNGLFLSSFFFFLLFCGAKLLFKRGFLLTSLVAERTNLSYYIILEIN